MKKSRTTHLEDSHQTLFQSKCTTILSNTKEQVNTLRVLITFYGIMDVMKDITFHYTNEQMVKDLIAITPIKGSVLDAGSGKNKVWYNNLVGEKYECELDDGCDFLTQWEKRVNWIVGNPPFASNEIINGRHQNLIPQWIEKASQIADKGMAFLINHKVINFLTSARLEKLKEKGFYLTRIHIVADKRWFGRYYYIILEKKPNKFISWERKTY